MFKAFIRLILLINQIFIEGVISIFFEKQEIIRTLFVTQDIEDPEDVKRNIINEYLEKCRKRKINK